MRKILINTKIYEVEDNDFAKIDGAFKLYLHSAEVEDPISVYLDYKKARSAIENKYDELKVDGVYTTII